MTEPTAMLDSLRYAMRGLASAVAIITVRDPHGTPYAMAATSVTSLSFDPPSMLVCVNRTASLYPTLAQGQDFCINIPHHAQFDVLEHCWTKAQGAERFADGAWDMDGASAPMLRDAQAAILCHQVQRIGHGTHDIVIGNVADVRVSGHIDPLVFLDGRYERAPAAA